MQVEQINSEKLKREYNITVPAADFEVEVSTRLKALAKDLKMPGFRPGKVPMDIVKKNYSQKVLGEVLEILVDKTSRQAIEKEGVRPALRPKIEILDFKEGSDLKYKMALEVLPEVPAIEFDGIAIERPKVEVTDKEVEDALNKISSQSKDFSKVERASKIGDSVKIDFKGFVGDEAFEGGEGKDFQLELGSNSFIPGFEDQLVGKEAGQEVDVNVTFPAEYHSEDLAGKESLFKVTIHEVQESVAVQPSDELAKKLGFEDLDGLRGAIKGQIKAEVDGVCRAHAKKSLFDILSNKFDFEVPEEMEKMEFDSVWQQVEEAKKTEPDSPEFDKPEDELKTEYKEMAHRRVQLGILLSDLGMKNKITVEQEEINQAVLAEARQYPGQEQKVFEFYRDHPENLESLKGPALEEKVVDFILEKITINDKVMSVDELQNLDQ